MTNTQAKAPNLIKLAISAAGGRTKVAEHFGVGYWIVTNWTKRGTVPADKVRALCHLGANVITPDALLAYIEARAAGQTAQEGAAA